MRNSTESLIFSNFWPELSRVARFPTADRREQRIWARGCDATDAIRMCKTFIMTLLFNTSSAAPCNRPLGLSSGRLPNNRMTASSEVNQFYAARLARLGRGKRGKYSGAWCSRHKNHYQWLKVDFGRLMKITQVLTQGRQDYGQWVTSYYLSSSVDNVHWAMYRFRSGNKVRRNALRYIIPWQSYDLDVIFGFASSMLDVPFWIIESAGCQQRTETEMSKRKRVLNLRYYFSTFFLYLHNCIQETLSFKPDGSQDVYVESYKLFSLHS